MLINCVAVVTEPSRLIRVACLPLLSAFLMLAGCGGGGERSADSQSPTTTAAPGPVTNPADSDASATQTPTAVPADAPTDAEAARFLIQSTYGATMADIATVQQIGYSAWIDEQFDLERIDTHRGYLTRKGPIGCNPCDSNYINAVMESFWLQAVRSPDQLRQRTVFALSEIFVTSALNSNGSLEIIADAHGGYHDMLARNAFGNFRQLLEDVATHPAMGFYLSHFKNEKESADHQPDENFAREIMQLFSIGLVQLNIDGTPKLDGDGQAIPTYNRFDVEGMAKVFTGWGWGNGNWNTHPQAQPADHWYLQMQNYPQYHSSAEKRMPTLGLVIPANTNGEQSLKLALDTLFNHPNVGPFIGSQLIKRFVTSNPSREYITRVAQAFNDNGQGVRGDMKAVVSAVLLDPEARSAAKLTDSSWGKLREPMIRYGNFMRTFDVKSPSGVYQIWNLEDPISSLGQNPMRQPSVFNWYRPDYSPQGVVRDAGLLAPEFQLVHEGTITSWVNFIDDASHYETPWGRGNGEQRFWRAADLSKELELATQPQALVDRLNLLLAANQLGAQTRTAIVDAVNSINGSDTRGRQERVSAAITLVMSCPEYMIQK